MSGPPPNYTFPNQHQHAPLSNPFQQQFQAAQLQQNQQHQLIKQLHQESRERRDKIRNKPFPSTVTNSTRDRQARGKDVYGSSDDDKTDEEEEEEEEEDDEEDEEEEEVKNNKPIAGRSVHKNLDDINDDDLEDGDDEESNEDADILRSCKAEDFETRERRAFAAAVLDRPEQLMMYAQSTNDSIASQRQRFTAMLCGYDKEEDWSNMAHYKATVRAAQERQRNMRKSMNIDRRSA
ncbi:hypothetical protein ACHAQJ_004126 [Trichoderma viride]